MLNQPLQAGAVLLKLGHVFIIVIGNTSVLEVLRNAGINLFCSNIVTYWCSVTIYCSNPEFSQQSQACNSICCHGHFPPRILSSLTSPTPSQCMWTPAEEMLDQVPMISGYIMTFCTITFLQSTLNNAFKKLYPQ